MPSTVSKFPTDALERELVALTTRPIIALRADWRALFKTAPPAAFGPDLLRRAIARELQEQQYGGLPAAARHDLRASGGN